MKKGGVALIGMIVALVFILVAFFGPWYGVSGSAMGVSISEDIGLTSGIGQSGIDRGILDVTMYLAIIALIFAIIAFIGSLGAAFNFGNFGTMKKVGGGFGILTFLLAIIAVFYFYANLPDTAAMEAAAEAAGVEFSAGIAWGWIIMLLGAIIALISSASIFKVKPAAQ